MTEELLDKVANFIALSSAGMKITKETKYSMYRFLSDYLDVFNSKELLQKLKPTACGNSPKQPLLVEDRNHIYGNSCSLIDGSVPYSFLCVLLWFRDLSQSLGYCA